jgi:hypothetical protein
MNRSRTLPLLLLEPSALLRQTVALTAISIGAGSVWQASNVREAQELLQARQFAGAVVAVDEDEGSTDGVLQLIVAIRGGTLASAADMPVYVLASACSRALLEKLHPLEIQRVLIKPFKARLLIEALSSISS